MMQLMYIHYLNYYWDQGIPKGTDPVDPAVPISYRITSDPYRKRITIEKYHHNQFYSIVYDSNLFDFRKLSPAIQESWERVSLSESEDQLTCLIKDENDLAVCIEVHTYEKGMCTLCEYKTASNQFLIATQKLYYQKEGHPKDVGILYDMEGKIVFEKELL